QPWNTVLDLTRKPLAHEPRADHADANGRSLLLSGAKCGVDDDHDGRPPIAAPTASGCDRPPDVGLGSVPRTVIRRLTSGSTSQSGLHAASFGEISATGRGHSSPS